MSPPLIRGLGLALVLVCLAWTACLAQEDFRAVLGSEAGVFPGAEFKKIFRFPKATVVTFETGAPPAAFSKLAFFQHAYNMFTRLQDLIHRISPSMNFIIKQSSD